MKLQAVREIVTGWKTVKRERRHKWQGNNERCRSHDNSG